MGLTRRFLRTLAAAGAAAVLVPSLAPGSARGLFPPSEAYASERQAASNLSAQYENELPRQYRAFYFGSAPVLIQYEHSALRPYPLPRAVNSFVTPGMLALQPYSTAGDVITSEADAIKAGREVLRKMGVKFRPGRGVLTFVRVDDGREAAISFGSNMSLSELQRRADALNILNTPHYLKIVQPGMPRGNYEREVEAELRDFLGIPAPALVLSVTPASAPAQSGQPGQVVIRYGSVSELRQTCPTADRGALPVFPASRRIGASGHAPMYGIGVAGEKKRFGDFNPDIIKDALDYYMQSGLPLQLFVRHGDPIPTDVDATGRPVPFVDATGRPIPIVPWSGRGPLSIPVPYPCGN
ncbi:MAG: hypothetical protein HYW26_04865 [Candidatus Aenigmarchaeota archaeon]|nr:hypothetical protein [Candidatus Aenigmarchaeota archaeon]